MARNCFFAPASGHLLPAAHLAAGGGHCSPLASPTSGRQRGRLVVGLDAGVEGSPGPVSPSWLAGLDLVGRCGGRLARRGEGKEEEEEQEEDNNNLLLPGSMNWPVAAPAPLSEELFFGPPRECGSQP